VPKLAGDVNVITTHPVVTARRKGELDAYYRRSLLGPDGFLCPQFDACRASHPGTFHEGQVHHVGDHYDLAVSGIPLRIVIVGQEYGHGPARVGPSARSEMVMESAGKVLGFNGRNPHMQGTTTALRVLLGRSPADDPEGEWIEAGGRLFHLFEAFALANYLLCSATAGSMRGKATRTMLGNCARHFRTVMHILEPTVVVCQGKGFFRYVADVLGVPRTTDNLFRYRIGGTEGVGVGLNHPSTPHWDHGWAKLHQPYLAGTVVPLLQQLRIASGLAT